MRSLLSLMFFKLLSQDAAAGASAVGIDATATAPVPEKPKAIVQNGVPKPGEGTKCAEIWKLADSLSAQHGRPAKRSEVIDGALVLGINPATASTQFGRWHRFWGIPAEPRVVPTKPAAEGTEAPAKAPKKGKKGITVTQGNAALDTVVPEGEAAPAVAVAE